MSRPVATTPTTPATGVERPRWAAPSIPIARPLTTVTLRRAKAAQLARVGEPVHRCRTGTHDRDAAGEGHPATALDEQHRRPAGTSSPIGYSGCPSRTTRRSRRASSGAQVERARARQPARAARSWLRTSRAWARARCLPCRRGRPAPPGSGHWSSTAQPPAGPCREADERGRRHLRGRQPSVALTARPRGGRRRA